MRAATYTNKSKQRWLTALCAAAILLGSASVATAGEHRGHGPHGQHHAWKHSGHDKARHASRSHERRYSDRQRHRDGRDLRNDGRRYDAAWYRRSGWHYSKGRYWAPPRYRGRYCQDRRHHHGVHYHVAVRDYYDYYYPRYRYYGPKPIGANASVIISIPLF